MSSPNTNNKISLNCEYHYESLSEFDPESQFSQREKFSKIRQQQPLTRNDRTFSSPTYGYNKGINNSSSLSSSQQEIGVTDYVASKIKATAQQAFPNLEITQESVGMLTSFVQDTLVWIVMESGKISTSENANWISSRHIHFALRKLLVGSSSRNGSLSSEELSAFTTTDTDSHQIPTPVLDSVLRTNTDENLNTLVDNFFASQQSEPHEKITDYFKVADSATTEFMDLLKNENSEDGDWVSTGVKDDVYMSKRGMYVRGEAEIEKPAKLVFEHLKDINRRKAWDTLLQEAKVVEDLDKYTQILYMKYGYGGCLLRTQRDFCVISHWFSQSDGSYVHVAQSTAHDQCPIVDGVLRASIANAGYIVRPKGDGSSCVVTHCVRMDLNAPTPVVTIIHQKELTMLSRLRFNLTGSRLLTKK